MFRCWPHRLLTVEFGDDVNPIVLQIIECDIGDILFHVGSEGFDQSISAADFVGLQSSFRSDQNIVVQNSTIWMVAFLLGFTMSASK